MKKILISDKLNPLCVEMFEKAGHTVDFKPGISAEELLSIISDYNAILVRSRTKVTKEVIEAGKKLEIIGRA
ncbi:MAG: phosphoglycerate dehydrogenase, partial [Ignavibacteria bacterium]